VKHSKCRKISGSRFPASPPAYLSLPVSRPSTLLEARNIGLRLEERWLFRNLSFSIPTGAFISLTGPSGVGKTSLLRILSRELSPTEGELFCPLDPAPKKAMIFQDLQLAEGASSLTNVLSGSLGKYSSIKTLFGFPQKEKERGLILLRELGLEMKSNQWASTLSRGERQRLAICRTLLSHPTLLFADEPVASLDSEWADKTLATLLDSQTKKGGSIICSLHDELQVQQFSNYILRLNPSDPSSWSWEEPNPIS